MSINNDELLSMGFGELTEEEEARLTAELSGDEAQELAEWAQISRDLKGLKDVPPCQLTSDHLREAILSRGIQPAKSGLSWGWLSSLGLAAAACFAVAAYMTYGYYQPVSKPGSGAVASTAAVRDEAVKVESSHKEPSPVAVREKPKTAFKLDGAADELDFNALMANNDEPDYPTTVRRSQRGRRAAMVQAVNSSETVAPEAIGASEPSIREDSPVEPVVTTSDPAPAPAPAGDIVVINAPTVGAQQAPPSEVERTANVVFGG